MKILKLFRAHLLLPLFISFNTILLPQSEQSTLVIYADSGKNVISKHIYGHFSEHLGRCIYGGLWVGDNSAIPNTDGVRNDIIDALKHIKIPNLRWPGGCFADEYHWMDGIGPGNKRPKMVNTNWGGVTEDNSFGTHEFLNLCELLGTEPYISANAGSGTVEEMAKWVEYVNASGETPMANLRRENGRDKPWNVKFWGIGNESWGCGGNMRPEYYSDQFRKYATYCKDYGDNKLFKIASGAYDFWYEWSETLLKNISSGMNGMSLHYYTVKGWEGSKGFATDFNTDEYFATLKRCTRIEEAIVNHIAVMDKYDPEKKISLIVDEWGTWFDTEPGTNPAFLYQQNTLRDAFVAALSFNIFHKYCERIKMANIAQLVNVLQALILTDNEKMLLTPTYHVFDLYKVHQDAVFLPVELKTGNYVVDNDSLPAVSATASKNNNGVIHISLVNIDPENGKSIICNVKEYKLNQVSGNIITSGDIKDHNTFDEPDKIRIKEFKDLSVKDGKLLINLPAKSIVEIELK
jgi:alpha-N-arabinofuranosidase